MTSFRSFSEWKIQYQGRAGVGQGFTPPLSNWSQLNVSSVAKLNVVFQLRVLFVCVLNKFGD